MSTSAILHSKVTDNPSSPRSQNSQGSSIISLECSSIVPITLQHWVSIVFLSKQIHVIRSTKVTSDLGYSAIFINALPQGYVLERRARAENTSSRSYARQRVNYDDYIHGHPSGRPYRSVRDFARHVYHIMRDDLANCDCSLC